MSKDYITNSGIKIIRSSEEIIYTDNFNEELIHNLNNNKGMVLISNYTLSEKYSKWDIGFLNPPIVIQSKGLDFSIKSLNVRGNIILEIIDNILNKDIHENITIGSIKNNEIIGSIHKTNTFLEEDRIRKPSIISIVRILRNIFYNKDDDYLGLYGALGYDLVYQFEDIKMVMERKSDKDLILFIPDVIYIIDRLNRKSNKYTYNFIYQDYSTIDKKIDLYSKITNNILNEKRYTRCDHIEGEYRDSVSKLKDRFKNGDMFECVLSQQFSYNLDILPSNLFLKLLNNNKSPYCLFINMGKGEYLIGASPEVFIKVTGKRVESCPISGTIKKGENVFENTQKIIELLTSKKEESELVMCTDIDRNDKSKVCDPGTIKVLSHRKIEPTERLYHTVDHVEGYIMDKYDGLDALIAHLWAVTLTGSPKIIAIDTIEKMEKSPRQWYGGAVGIINFNGNINTCITIRTFHVKDQFIHFRVGATLLYDSDPKSEEEETLLKASNFIELLRNEKKPLKKNKLQKLKNIISILVIDFEDSFIYTVIGYLRNIGFKVMTLRWYKDYTKINTDDYSIVILSPGPKHPKDYPINKMLDFFINEKKKILGICLGHQAIIRYFGGKLKILDHPIHGKKSSIILNKSDITYNNIDLDRLDVARYHSIYSDISDISNVLNVTSYTDNNIVMSISHKDLPIYGLQYHPESILTNEDIGYQILMNILKS